MIFGIVDASLAHAAVTIDANANSGNPTTGCINTTITISASSTLLLVWVGSTNQGVTVSSVKVGGTCANGNGTAATQVANARNSNGGGSNGVVIDLWSCAVPSVCNVSGSTGVAVTTSAGNSSAVVVSFLGSNGTLGTPVKGNGAAGSVTESAVTSATGNLVVDLVEMDVFNSCPQTMTPGGSQTAYSGMSLCTANVLQLSGSSEAGAASVQPSWTFPSNITFTYVAIDVHAAASAKLFRQQGDLTGLGVGGPFFKGVD